MYKLEGMYAAIPTPFLEDESVDLEGVKTLVNFLANEGLHGIIVCGSTGEYTVMSTEERKAVIKAACEASQGRISVVAGVGCPRAVDTIELCNYAAEVGADAALVITPHYMVMTEEMLYEFYTQVADGSRLGIIIYHYPLATGVTLSPELIRRLALHENIVALKNTEDMDHTARVIGLTADNDGFHVANGYDSLIVPSLAGGCNASMGVVHNIVPKIMEEIYALVQRNDVKRAAELHASLFELIMLLDAEPYPGPVKVALELMGLPGGAPRRPIAPPSEKMRIDMKECLTRLGVL